jgi:hypothetical protein
VRLSPLGTLATNWPLVPAQGDDDDECEAVGEIRIGRGSRSARRKPATVTLCSPQIPHALNLCSNADRRGGKPATNRLS